MSEQSRKRNRTARIKKAARKEMEVITKLSTPNKIIKMNSVEFDPIIFQPMKTEKAIDLILDQDGGVPRASNYIVVGDPGIGKCVIKETFIKVRNKKTGKITEIEIGDFHQLCK